MLSIAIWMFPARRSCSAAPVPLYGTCTIWIPAADLKSSPERWLVAPMPALPKLIVFGFALASSISSFTVFAGTLGCTTRRFGTTTRREIGAKSFTGS